MRPRVLVVGGLVVAAAVIALVVALGKNDSARSPGATGSDGTTATSGTPSTPTGTRPALPPVQDGTTGQPGTSVTIGGSSAATTPGGPPPIDTRGEVSVTQRPRDGSRGSGAGSDGSAYSVADVEIRDHRGGSAAPIDVPPSMHTPDGARISPDLTAAIGQQVKQVLLACAAQSPKRSSTGTRPRVDGQIVIVVKSGQLGIQSAIMQPHDIDTDAAASIKACSEPKILQLTAAAPSQADLANYGINVTVNLPITPPS